MELYIYVVISSHGGLSPPSLPPKNNNATERSPIKHCGTLRFPLHLTHFVHRNVGSDFSDTRFGLVDTGQRGWRETQ
jgi:hypothetical protein